MITAAPAALRMYAVAAGALGYDSAYVADISKLADEFEEYQNEHGRGDPDAPPHRTDDPAVIRAMKGGATSLMVFDTGQPVVCRK